MQFSSSVFIFIFLPIAIALYYLVKVIFKNNIIAKNVILLISSLIFYFLGSGLYSFLLIIGYLLLTYVFGILLDKFKNVKPSVHTLIFIAFIVISSSFLIIYKALNVSKIKIVMPLAISFIVLQSISYLIDIKRDKLNVEYNILNFYVYSLLFTKLVSGPIMSYKSIKEYINNRNENFNDFYNGIIRFSFGLGKKVLIAGFIYPFMDHISKLDSSNINCGIAWLGLLSSALFLYYDFSSYSDMAVGLSKMFGFQIIENFNYPYTAFSITDFWRRWHISLSLWFKEYIYFPLGGSKKGLLRTTLNIGIVFILTGIWHGFTLTFLLWGIYFAIFMILERIIFLKILDKNKFKFLNVIYVLLIVSLSWVLFFNTNTENAFRYYGVLFGILKGDLISPVPFSYKTLIGLVLGVVFIGFIQRLIKPLLDKYKDNQVWQILTFTFSILLIAICSFFIITGTYSPSIYGGL